MSRINEILSSKFSCILEIKGVKIIYFDMLLMTGAIKDYFANNSDEFLSYMYENNIKFLKTNYNSTLSYFIRSNNKKSFLLLNCKNDDEFNIYLRKEKLLDLMEKES